MLNIIFRTAVFSGILAFSIATGPCRKTPGKVHKASLKHGSKSKSSKKNEIARPKTALELDNVASEHIASFDYKGAADTYRQMQSLDCTTEQRAKALFGQAKCLFLSGEYNQGAIVMDKFIVDFPINRNVTEAKYLSLLCKYNCAKKIPSGCDLRAIEGVVKLAQNLFTDEALMGKRTEVDKILKDCKERLLSKEVETFDLYLRTSDFVSAKNRLAKIKNEFQGSSTDFQPRILYLESKLAKASGEDEFAKELAQQLVQEYPDSRFSKMARSSFESFFATFV